MKKYKVPIPQGITDPIRWLGQFCNKDHYVALFEDMGIKYVMVEIDDIGVCIAPNAQEVV